MGSIRGLGRSPGEGNGYPLQYSGLENFLTKSRTWLSDFHFPKLLKTINSTWFMWMVLLICCWLWFAGLFFFLVALGLSCSMRDLFSCLMWDLVPWPGIKPRPSALGAQSYPLDHQGSSGLLVFYWQFLHRYWSKYWPVVFWYCLSFCFGIRAGLIRWVWPRHIFWKTSGKIGAKVTILKSTLSDM